MQSIEFKRLSPHRIGITVAALGTLAIVLAGTGALFDASNDSGGSPRNEVRSTQRTAPVYSDAFLEWNTNLPDVGADPIQPVAGAGGEPLELNMTPPDTLRPSVRSYDDTLFLEMNMFLPGTRNQAVQSSDQMRFLEMNQLPGDDAPYLPGHSGAYPVSLTDY